MTRSCRDVLNHLRELSDNDFALLTFVSDAPCICLRDNLSKRYDYSKHEDEIGAIIQELARTKYLVCDDHCIQMRLTYKGLHPCAMTWEELKSFFFRSVAVPVVVSAITTLVTLWLQSLRLQ